MPSASMTGFARDEGHDARYRWAWEAKSVNGRGLDVRFRLPAGLDRIEATARTRLGERFKRGEMAIDAKIDLHGLTQAEAHDKLQGFLAKAAAAGKRCVLIVTGKGAGGWGVLRDAVPRWLNEPELRRHLLAFSLAQSRHGGACALYALRKRKRES